MPPMARVRRAPRRESDGLSSTAPRRRKRPVSLSETSPFRRPSAPAQQGERFGPYMIYERLGEGGMGSVHRAEVMGVAGFRKAVALKRMHTALTEDRGFVEAFIHEAQLVSCLRHPNIAQAFDLGKIDGAYFLAMELVPGPTLGQLMRQSRRAAGAIPLPIVIEILIQLCDALEYAHDLHDDAGHSLHLIHRDVSPANVIVSSSGSVKLIDFGIAKDRSSRSTTEAGIVKGKHAYLAPEYTYGQLDRRADLFGVGVIAHEMLTGRRLFLADSEAQTIRDVRGKLIHPPSRYAPEISRDLDDIVMTALQRDPELRWQNAGAMRAALGAEQLRLRAAVSGAQIRAWVEWAFLQEDWRESQIGRIIDDLEPSISIESGIDWEVVSEIEPVEPSVAALPTRVLRPNPGPRTARIPRAAPARPETSRWLILLLVLTTSGAAFDLGWLAWWLDRLTRS
ncbi:MAG: serine/threonine protein kinase [Deltaproteobacteria bacterium]|nr:serine/threonine protein kinase [Deltaproteobacteria bacterium]